MAADAPDVRPNAERAVAEPRRVPDYLLNNAHPSGGPTSKFFMAYGFTATDWDLLRTSLLQHGGTNSIVRRVETAWGIRYTGACNSQTPDGRNPCIRTVWQMEYDVPRLLASRTGGVAALARNALSDLTRVRPPSLSRPLHASEEPPCLPRPTSASTASGYGTC